MKKGPPNGEPFHIPQGNKVLFQLVHKHLSLTLEVARFVLVNYVVLCKLIEHAHHLWQKGRSLFLGSQRTQFAHGIAHSLVVIFVAQTLSVVATNASDS